MEVYLDHAATTQVSPRVLEKMIPYFKQGFGNPSSIHKLGFSARKAYNQSKRKIARVLHCDKDEIHFTSGGTEATNWALKGLAYKYPNKKEIITTKIEHHATLHTVAFLENQGYTIHYINVDEQGFIDLDMLKSTITEQTLVVSIIYANNEIGTIQDISTIEKVCHEHNTLLHIDAVQATCHVPLNLHQSNVDLASISGHKFHAPKGVGILYKKSGIEIENLIHGGQQENGLRSGTENIPYIVGLAEALEVGMEDIIHYRQYLDQLSHQFLQQLDDAGIDYILNGPKVGPNRLPGHLNLAFKDLDNNDITFYLNQANIYASTGSACDSESITPSHVLLDIGVDDAYLRGAVRFSMGNETTKDDIVYVTKELITIIQKLSANR
ncbi:MAG: cysteine desulfurase family protein [Candidatus Izemoplasma sp.]|nr:cysteine desulfurase family protein [Candidatus Izemoplasma sp.]